MGNLTPMMQQYFEIKHKHKDSILFFRLGDFYEMFFDDAITASKELEITLTGRDCGQEERAPMCGVPFHSADSYIAKLVEKGYKVAICEQVEDPSKAVGIVKRDVVRVITPGTITDTNALDEKSNNFLCCIYMDDEGYGLSYVDISTGELCTTEVLVNSTDPIISLINELGKIMPTEIIANSYLYDNTETIGKIKRRTNCFINAFTNETFDFHSAKELIKTHFAVISLDGLGLSGKNHSIMSLGTTIQYLNETQKITLNHLNNIHSYSCNSFMTLDISTRRNLELIETMRGKSKKGSLISMLDKTSTAMGGRLLRKWIEEPLLDKTEIESRFDVIEYFTSNIMIMNDIEELLKKVYDLERLMGKIVYGNCNARDLIAMKNSLKILPDIKSIIKLNGSECTKLNGIVENMDCLDDIYTIIHNSIEEDPPLTIKDGGIIKSDYNQELKGLREAASNGKEWLSQLEEKERNSTGIKNLKIGFNKVFGYFLEVSKSNIKLVPDYYIRKQTLSNSERYITPDLKEMESKILGAEEKMTAIEYDIFNSIRDEIRANVKRIQDTSKRVATIDALISLSQVAYKNNYVRPEINDKGTIEIKNGRHPVVEKMLEGELFVPNDTYLDTKNNRISIITGPNMAGKSTYMRQVALITLMAQVGSFVPAEKVSICIVDRIFTRIGASDDLSQGQSTFMVEMTEVANILNNATNNSLIILDEIGRGTSTYDGLSIAWAVIEYISDTDKLGAKTLFATHYHELTELECKLDGVKNYSILVQEKGENIIFLRKIVQGGADRSYGIEVAKLAGVRNEVIERAYEILNDLEKKDLNVSDIAITCDTVKNEYQLDLFKVNENRLIEELRNINMMNITPIQAMNILYRLCDESKKI
ncbi:DNA mismatch repair protein MutS [Brassicibacter mesophilus]|uniref:DNA mismatch repair protein MutS n=1 Tax=Brassicibacter mesophilus TaxID=745119 RepID=UPI003D21F7D5